MIKKRSYSSWLSWLITIFFSVYTKFAIELYYMIWPIRGNTNGNVDDTSSNEFPHFNRMAGKGRRNDESKRLLVGALKPHSSPMFRIGSPTVFPVPTHQMSENMAGSKHTYA